MRDPKKEKRTLCDGFPESPETVKLTESISETLKQNHKGKELPIVVLVQELKDTFKAHEEDVRVALSTLINRGEIIVKSVCFLGVNTVRIPE